MPLPLIYHEDYSPEFPADHRFPMDKFRLLRDHLVDSGLTRDSQLLRPPLCPADILALAHEPGYIERYMSGELSREDQRRLGLPWSEPLARRTVRAVGGSLLAAEQALEHGLACAQPHFTAVAVQCDGGAGGVDVAQLRFLHGLHAADGCLHA